jgi:hypothetical protein
MGKKGASDMTKFVPVIMTLSALAAATAVGLASPAFSQGVPQVECNQSWVPAIQNCRVVNNNPGSRAWGYVPPAGQQFQLPRQRSEGY